MEFSVRVELSTDYFPGGRGVLYVKRIFHVEISRRGKEFVMEGEPDFPVLFKKN